MQGGFFSNSTIVSKKPLPLIPQCGACQLYKNCNSPKMPVSGKGRKRILIVGEAPGQQEDSQGKPFVGKTGQFLEDILYSLGVRLREDCWITNAIICHPKHPDGRNRTPSDKEIEWCRPNLVNTVKELNPEKIILLGGVPLQSLLGWIWKEDIGRVGRWVGWKIPSQQLNAYVCPTWHPSFIVRMLDEKKGGSGEVEKLLFTKHLKEALELGGRPWPSREEVPRYSEEVKIIYDPDKAARLIRKYNSLIAIDYECATSWAKRLNFLFHQ